MNTVLARDPGFLDIKHKYLLAMVSNLHMHQRKQLLLVQCAIVSPFKHLSSLGTEPEYQIYPHDVHTYKYRIQIPWRIPEAIKEKPHLLLYNLHFFTKCYKCIIYLPIIYLCCITSIIYGMQQLWFFRDASNHYNVLKHC